MKKHLPEAPNPFGFPDHWNDAKVGSASLPELVGQVVPQVSAILGSVSMILMILAVKVLIAPHRISCHLFQPFKEQLVFNLFQNLLYWFSEYGINRLGVGRSWLPNKIIPRSVIVVPIQPEIPPLLRDHLSLSFSLQLVFFYSSVFVNPIQLAYISNRFTS